MDKVKKGDRYTCEPCGREVVVDACGVSEATLWCCGSPMTKAAGKKPAKKTGKKK